MRRIRAWCFLCLNGALAFQVAVGHAAEGPRQDPSPIQAAAESHALRLARQQGLVDVQVEALRMDRRLRLAACQQALNTSSNTGRVSGRVTVAVRCPDKPGWSLYVPVKVSANIRAIVLQNSLPRGSVLTADDLEVRRMAVTAVRSDYIGSVDDALGKALRRPGRAGSVLYVGLLETPAAVKRGQETDLLVAMGGVEVKMQGKALSDGAPGELIKVVNKSSGKTVEGIVTPEGWVRVP